MPLTPATLPRHELVGLTARVAAAPNPDLVGVGGRVVDETRSTLVLAVGSGATVRVPKPSTTFEFRLPESGADTDATHVTVDGSVIESRPALRTENAPTPGGDDTWR